MIIYMIQTIAFISKGDPQFPVPTPTRMGQTEFGPYLVYETEEPNFNI
jgi:hypothetical protein